MLWFLCVHLQAVLPRQYSAKHSSGSNRFHFCMDISVKTIYWRDHLKFVHCTLLTWRLLCSRLELDRQEILVVDTFEQPIVVEANKIEFTVMWMCKSVDLAAVENIQVEGVGPPDIFCITSIALHRSNYLFFGKATPLWSNIVHCIAGTCSSPALLHSGHPFSCKCCLLEKGHIRTAQTEHSRSMQSSRFGCLAHSGHSSSTLTVR